MKKEVVFLDSKDATIVRTVNGGEIWIVDHGGKTALCIPTSDGGGEGLLLDENGEIRVIAELSRRLAARSERIEALAGQALARGTLDACPRCSLETEQ